MKTQVRKHTFETNSSSTHSLQLSKGSTNDAKLDLIKSIMEESSYEFKSELNGTSLTLHGLPLPDGDESRNVYVIISSWEAKLQYVTGLLYDIISDNDKPQLEEILKSAAMKYANAHDIKIDNVIVDDRDGIYIDDYDDTCDDIRSLDDITKFIDLIMEDDYNMIYKDEAYSPYEGSEIAII